MPSVRYRRVDWALDITAGTQGARLSFARGATIELDHETVDRWEEGLAPKEIVDAVGAALRDGTLGETELQPTTLESALRRLVIRSDRVAARRPWEELFGRIFPEVMTSRVCVVPPSSVDLPLSLPMRIVEIDDSAVSGIVAGHAGLDRRLDDPTAEALVRVAAVSATAFEQWRADTRWPTIDVVHIRLSEMGPRLLSVAHPSEAGTLGWLRRLMLRSATRLVVVACAEDQAPAARELAAALVDGGGPAVVIAPEGANLADFYGFLLHDRPIDAAAHHARRLRPSAPPLTLFGGAGREELVRFSQVAEQLLDVADVAARGGGLDELDEVAGRARHVDDPAAVVSAIEEVIRPEVTSMFPHDRDRGGPGPLGESVAKLRAVLGISTGDAPALIPLAPGERFVNSSLRHLAPSGRPGREVPRAAGPLDVGSPYVLAVDVGPRSGRPSLRASALLEEMMAWETGDEGRFVEVGVTGLDFEVAGSAVQLLWVPRRAPSDRVFFLVTPRRAGASALRFSVFVDDAIVQSFLVGALTTSSDGVDADRQLLAQLLQVDRSEIDGTWLSRMEFAMTSTGDDLLDERPAGLSLVVNDRDGDAVVTVKGGDVFHVTRSARLPDMVRGVRAALASISTPPIPGVLPEHLRYGFSSDESSLNAGDDVRLGAALTTLAPLGWALFDHLFEGADRHELADRTAANDTDIRVAHLLLDKVVPWAALYDREYDATRTQVKGIPVEHTVCLAGLPHEPATLPEIACGELSACALHEANLPGGLTVEDRDRYATVVACPLRFWGFRHRIELPAGGVDRPLSGEAPERQVPDKVSAARPPRLGVASHTGLGRYKQHLVDIGNLLQPAWVAFDADEVKDRLVDDLDLDLVYLYCHAEGGLESGVDPPVLRFKTEGGAEGTVRAENLGSTPWPHNPLVVINGCHTAAFRPDALSPFIEKLTRDRRAAGVLGTEISVWEHLAVEVGLGFLRGLLSEQDAGGALLAVRRRLLAKRNPLGLAYTLYARSSLRLGTDA